MPIHVIDPKLRAGWEPDTPASHSLLRAFLINWTMGIESQSEQLGGQTLRRDDLAASDIGRASFGANVTTLLAPLFAEDATEVMAVLDGFYGFSDPGTGDSRKTGAVYLFSPWPVPDLRPHGWSLMGYEPLMLRPAGGEAPPPPSGLRIEAVRDEAGLLAFEQALVRGFGASDLEAQLPGAVFGAGVLRDPRERLWVGWEGGTPVCAAAAFVEAGIVDVTLVGTVPEARRRGYGGAVTWMATLAESGLPAFLLATDEGRPVYERMGYLPHFMFSVWSRERHG